MTISTTLIALGVAFAILGLIGVFWCILLARKVKAGAVPEDQLQATFIKLSAVNMAGMGLAFIGLAMLLVGLIL